MIHQIIIDMTQPEPVALHSPFKGSENEFSGDITLKRLVWAGDSGEVELLAVVVSSR